MPKGIIADVAPVRHGPYPYCDAKTNDFITINQYVARVTRCKDCKHEFGGRCSICGFQKRNPEDFCSRGERKDDADG